jgi:hypothetical protein
MGAPAITRQTNKVRDELQPTPSPHFYFYKVGDAIVWVERDVSNDDYSDNKGAEDAEEGTGGIGNDLKSEE